MEQQPYTVFKKPGPLTAADLQQGQIYRAKKPAKIGFIPAEFNDRMIIRHLGNRIQYDSPTIKNGRKYPIVTVEEFLKWAGCRVELPLGEWADWDNKGQIVLEEVPTPVEEAK